MKRPSPVIALLFFLFSLGALFLFSFLYALIAPTFEGTAFSHWVSLLLELGIYGLPVALFFSRRSETQSSLCFTPLPLRYCYSLAIAAMSGVYVFNFLSLLTTLLLGQLNLTVAPSSIDIPGNFSGLLMLLISSAAAPAVCEEMLFRGLIFPSLEPRGRRYALIFSALLFALPHGEVAGFPSLFLFGILLGVLVLRTGSLIAPIIYHFFHNAYILCVNYLAGQTASASAAAETLNVSFSDLLSYFPGFLCFGAIWFFSLRSIFRAYPAPAPVLTEPVNWKYYVLTALSILFLLLLFLSSLLTMINGGTL